MEIKTVAVFGVGAVGVIYASRLAKVLDKENLIIFSDGERKIRYEKQGLFLNSERLDFNYSDNSSNPVDLVIIATKNLQLKEIILKLKGFVGKKTIIMSILNGLVSEEMIARVYGEEKVLYSFAMGLNSEHVKNRINCTSEGKIVFGEKNNKITPRIKELEKLFSLSKINYLVPDDILLEMWKKFALNTAYNTLSAICSAGYGFFDACNPLSTLTDDVLKEVQLVAKKEGIYILDEHLEQIKQTINQLPFNGKTSMFQDFEAGRKSENSFFTLTMVEKAKKYSIQVPVCETLYRIAETMEFVKAYNKGK